jgi:hypothetical protein
VYVGGMDGIAYDGLRSARVYFHIASSDCFEDCSGVERGLIERSVAVDGRDA